MPLTYEEIWLEIEDEVRRHPETGEQWRDVIGWEGLYQVSNLGQVRSIDRISTDSHGRQRCYKGCVLRPCCDDKGYFHVNLCNGKIKRETPKVHILVMMAWMGSPSEGEEICHGRKGITDNSLSNLSYNTHRENGLQRRRDGTDNGRPVRRSDGVIYPSLTVAAEDVGCYPSHICNVCKGKYGCHTAANWGWSYIEPDKLGTKRKGRPIRRSDGKVFASIAEAVRVVNGHHGSIRAVCQGQRKTHRGYGWEYVNEEK